jgi:mono/diheme cytochrome c family protein
MIWFRTMLAGLIFGSCGVSSFAFAAPPATETPATGAPQAVASAKEENGEEFFERKIRPLLVQHCFSCHGKGQKKGELSLNNRESMLAGGDSGAAVVLGKPDESLLIQAIERNGDIQMPPNGQLAADEIAAIKHWVALGAPWPADKSGAVASGLRAGGAISDDDRSFWSFQPVRDVPLPLVEPRDWPRQTLDHFILAQLKANQLEPSAEAGKLTLLRRAMFDLTGLPPSPDEVEAFMSDGSPQAYERLIERLLASPQYGERWARHWLDVARYGEDQAHTFQARLYPNGYRYRDWVVKALNDDMPYDRFVVEQIAGDLVKDTERLDHLPALGYFALGPVYYGDAGCAGRARADEYDDRVDTLCRGFLALTVSCARCHDHKFDPITTQDYYALAGVFASSKYQESPLAPPDEVKKYDDALAQVKAQEKILADAQTEESRKLGETFTPDVARYMVAAWRVQQRRKTDAKFSVPKFAKELQLHDSLVERWLQYLAPASVSTRSHLAAWKKLTEGEDPQKDLSEDPAAVEGVTRAAEEFQSVVVAAIAARDKVDADHEAKLAAATAEEKGKIRKAALDKPSADLLKDVFLDRTSPLAIPKDRLSPYLSAERKKFFEELQSELDLRKKAVGTKYPFAHGLTEGDPTNLQVHLRGNHTTLGDEVPRRFLAVLSNKEIQPFAKGSGREELARAIASPSNPLTARVMVNRIWQHHFGRGIVGTPSNFGLLGERPTHPELLDHLAHKFVASGWSIKQLHREIMLSATYRQASGFRESCYQRDPGNRLLWRMNLRRLDVESWRDAVLAISGSLDRTVGGPPANLNSPDNRRRTLYASISRHDLNGMLRLFDFPDPNLTSENRVVTTVPMQQLFVLNSEFMVRQSKLLAARLEKEKLSDDAAKIERTYRLLYGRGPTELESRVGLSFIQGGAAASPAAEVKLTAWEQYAQALLCANEFMFID